MTLFILNFCLFLLITQTTCLIPIQPFCNYSETCVFSLNKNIEYIIEYNDTQPQIPSRVTVSSNSKKDAPLMVVVRQKKEVLSWQLPIIVDTELGGAQFLTVSRTLCPDSITGYRLDNSSEGPIISISTSSAYNVSVNLMLERENDFYITHSTEYNISITPSQPKYYFYNFDTNNTDSSSVVLEINSLHNNCMTVSIQNGSCPVFDLNHDIKFEGYWESVNIKGGITISKKHFPNGFFVIFVVNGDDFACTAALQEPTSRHKSVQFILKPSISYVEYRIAVIVILTIMVTLFIALLWFFSFCTGKTFKHPAMPLLEQFDPVDISTPSTMTVPDFTDNISDETEYDTIAETEFDREMILGKPVLFLSDLARKDPRILRKKSYLYLWHVLTVALFYGLPVVQLVITYQKVLNDTGNQDLCYYNFLCAHPLGFFSDFNHIFSNIGYVLFGILFLCCTNKRERLHKDTHFDKHYGIPQHYGMFYAMGVALMMEGILSGSYHICPNHSNFQFDSSFMYVMAVLIMVKLYQTRHPDINATAYATFGVLAIAILLGMVGILEANIFFWVSFTVLHIVTCLILTAQIYYLGCWKLDRGLLKRVFNVYVHDFWAGPSNVLKPVHKGRMVLLVLGNIWNWTLAGLGLYTHDRDFATYLLAIFMSNTLLYFFFYCVMKLLHKERINSHATTYLILAIISAVTATYFFTRKSISWALTPAESRQFNQDCKLLQFYDFHDIWHFLSAIGMFFSFMMLLTLDDDLSHTHRSKIHVF